ncbi:MAG: PP0621 family protein [Betaproteobacteria bacterium]|jgi:uncharacterized protein
MKYLLVLIVVGVGIWLLAARFRKGAEPGKGHERRAEGSARAPEQKSGAGAADKAVPRPIVACRHCGVHLPADEAVFDGLVPYCGPSHQQAGPR